MNRMSELRAIAAMTISATVAQAQEAVLEHYVLASGGSPVADNGGFSGFIEDQRFGNGTAQASVYLDSVPGARLLHLRVWRHVPAGSIVFALLVFKVEVRGFDAQGAQVYSRDLADFSFGDSSPGNWARRLDLPREATRIEVRYLGNYE